MMVSSQYFRWHYYLLFYLRHIPALLSHTKTYSELLVTLTYTVMLYSELLTCLELRASSKACQTCKMTRQNSKPCYRVRTLCKHFQGYLGIFRDIDAYHSHSRGASDSPAFFWKLKKMLRFWEKMVLIADCVHLWVKFSFQNLAL